MALRPLLLSTIVLLIEWDIKVFSKNGVFSFQRNYKVPCNERYALITNRGKGQHIGKKKKLYVQVFYPYGIKSEYIQKPFWKLGMVSDSLFFISSFGKYPSCVFNAKRRNVPSFYASIFVDTLREKERVYIKFHCHDSLYVYNAEGLQVACYYVPKEYDLWMIDSTWIYGGVLWEDKWWLWIHDKADGKHIGAIPIPSSWQYVGYDLTKRSLYFLDRKHRRVHRFEE